LPIFTSTKNGNKMGEAKRKEKNISKKRIRFIHLLKIISKKYDDWQIKAFADRRKL
jgi:hypothetical protein